jgi:hypothetical protein
MSKERFISNQFIANKEIVDSLKIEGSVLSPEEDKKSMELARSMSEYIVTTYGQFMPKRSMEFAQTVHERVLVMADDPFRIMWGEWDQKVGFGGREAGDTIHAMYFYEGSLMVTKDPLKMFDEFTDEGQAEYIQQEGSEEAARKMLGNIEESDKAHEMMHSFHDPSLPQTWMECGVSYYARDIEEEFELATAVDELINQRIDFYANALTSYGDLVHNIFFGTKVNDAQKRRVLATLTKADSERLFPQGFGLGD